MKMLVLRPMILVSLACALWSNSHLNAMHEAPPADVIAPVSLGSIQERLDAINQRLNPPAPAPQSFLRKAGSVLWKNKMLIMAAVLIITLAATNSGHLDTYVRQAAEWLVDHERCTGDITSYLCEYIPSHRDQLIHETALKIYTYINGFLISSISLTTFTGLLKKLHMPPLM